MSKIVLFKGENIAGKKFNRLTILAPAGYDKFGQRLVHVRCDCGQEKIVRLYNVTSGTTKSCGCINMDKWTLNYCPHRKPEISPPGKVIWTGRDIAKKKYGELTILKETEPKLLINGNYRRRVLCRCSCGKLCEKDIRAVIYGTTKSCGHLRPIKLSEASKKHGMSRTRIYNIWIRIRSLANKGGAEIYPAWDDAANGFNVFHDWAVQTGYKETARLTRKDHNKGFNPDNCYWRIPKKQSTRQSAINPSKGKET